MKKLPENILRVNEDGQVVGTTVASFVSVVTKEYKVKDFKNEEGEVVKTAQDVVKNLILSHLNNDEGNFELPDSWSQYSKVSDAIAENVKEHLKAVDASKKQKDAEKEQKQQEAQQRKDEKEKEDKQYLESQESFEKFILAQRVKNAERADKVFGDTIKAIQLPKSIGFNGNSMGVTVSENATKDDIAVATANILGGFEGLRNAESALQFSMGDLVNESIKRKIFRSKGEATQAISFTIKEKLQKNYSAGAINFYALMSERVDPSLRKAGIAPSVFLEASKIVAPRNKEASKDEQARLEGIFDGARAQAIQKIYDGELTGVKDVKEFVKSVKTDNKLISGETISIGQIYNTLFKALWIKQNITAENELYTFFKSKNSRETFTITIADLSSTIESCMNSLQNILMAKDNIPALVAGKVVLTKGDKSEEKEHFMVDPFGAWVNWEPTPEPKKEEPKKEDAKKSK